MSLIARTWFGKGRRNNSQEYVEYVRSTGVKDLATTEGNLGVLVLNREGKEEFDIGVISFWRSLRDVQRFAGYNAGKAVYYPRDAEYLRYLEPEVQHYQVSVAVGLELGNGHSAGDLLVSNHKDAVKPETPYPGVRIRRLWKGVTGARALVVEIDAGFRFTQVDVHDTGPEEVYVVSGVFNDGTRDYPAGTFIHNPANSSHLPQSDKGCVLFVFYPEG